MHMFRQILGATAACITLASPAFAAECITSKGNFGAYKQTLAKQAAANGIGQQGLQALNGAKLSGITWRFESNPASQSGVSQGDPARFLAKRSGREVVLVFRPVFSLVKMDQGFI
jgi:membrane-bound lytic murein transglycosylase B